MKRFIAALIALFVIAVPLFAQRIPDPVPPIQLPSEPTYGDPIRPIEPIQPIYPSENAMIEDAKIRTEASKRIYEYRRVILTSTTSVTYWKDDNNYSARARFSIQSEDVAIRCVSNARAVVVTFLEYIRSIFSSDGSSADWSLDLIVRGARQDLRKRGFSDDDIILTYIDQFDHTHVVLISRQKLHEMIVCR